ncbi:MAG: hypothetical protein BIFFINMI_00863 [Phycisphaerae bacterium]|nr:hypothetical protein [Phycisphaerae bacterium]
MTRQFQRNTLAALAAGLLLAAAPGARVFAQLGMTPIIVESRGFAGGLARFRITVANVGAMPMDCDIRVKAMTVLSGGLPVEADDAPRSCKDWIEVEPTKFSLKAGESRALNCKLTVPKDAAGGYYAIISCTGVPGAGADAPPAAGVGATVRLTHRGLVPVLLTVPGSRVAAVIDAGKPIITPGAARRGYKFNVPVRNRGNIHTRLAGTVELRSAAGQLVEKIELEAGRGFLLPLHERLFEGDIPLNLPDGAYLATVRLGPKDAPPMQSVFPFYLKDGQPTVGDTSDELKTELLKQSAGFMVSPTQLDVDIQPGATRMQAVELINMTDKTLPVTVSLVQWQRLPDGSDAVGIGDPAHGRPGLEWVKLGQETVELRPLTRQRVPLTVVLPKDATGERYAAVLFNRADIKLDASSHGQARRSAMLRIGAQGTGSMVADVAEFTASRQPSGAVLFAARVRNSGDVSIRPEVRVSLSTPAAQPVGMAPPVTPLAIQAGSEAVVPILWTQALNPGEYIASVSVQYAERKPAVVKAVRFTVPTPQAAGDPPTSQPDGSPKPPAPAGQP